MKTATVSFIGLLAIISNAVPVQSATPLSNERSLTRVERAPMCVTNGTIEARDGGLLSIETPSSRAVVPGALQQIAEIRFRYLGPSAESKVLASGELRRQIGLKLRAQDSCNVIYAMWHIEPDSKFVVLIKRNPGMRTHKECGANGYKTVVADRMVPVKRVQVGELHSLRAELRGEAFSCSRMASPFGKGKCERPMSALRGPWASVPTMRDLSSNILRYSTTQASVQNRKHMEGVVSQSRAIDVARDHERDRRGRIWW